MKVNIKRLSTKAVIPTYAKPGDAGMDLTATSKIYDKYGNVSYGIGLAFEIPEGYVGLLFPRSSNSKQDLLLSNSVGVVDAGYRGEVFLKFKPAVIFADDDLGDSEESDYFDKIIAPNPTLKWSFSDYNVGDKISQIVIIPIPKIELNEVDNLSETDRGDGSFGHTGK